MLHLAPGIVLSRLDTSTQNKTYPDLPPIISQAIRFYQETFTHQPLAVCAKMTFDCYHKKPVHLVDQYLKPLGDILAMYFENEEYEGGSILFRSFALEFKPQLGDLLIFPNHFMYWHVHAPMIWGMQKISVTSYQMAVGYEVQDNKAALVRQESPPLMTIL